MARALRAGAVWLAVAWGAWLPSAAADVWLEEILASDGAELDQFGFSVAVDGDTALVGANLTDDACPENPDCQSGSAYVFVRDPATRIWTQQATLTAADGEMGDVFGLSVAVSGDIALVGAHLDDDLCPVDPNCNSGSAYIFKRDAGGTGWGEVVKLTPTDPILGGYFGRSVAMDGDIAVVGASRASGLIPNSGAAYVFERNAGGPDNWGQVAKLIASDGVAESIFGRAVAVSDGRIVVGALLDDSVCPWDLRCDSGAAYVFSRESGGTGGWEQTAKLVGNDTVGNDHFGWSVAIDGDLIVVGARLLENAATGAAYVFAPSSTAPSNWEQVKKLTADDGMAGDSLGWAVGVSGHVVVVGAYGTDELGSESGSAYVFAQHSGGVDAWGQTAKLLAPDGQPSEHFGQALAIDGSTALIGAPYGHNTVFARSGSAYLAELPPPPTGCPGDVDDDGDTDIFDFGVLATYFGEFVALNTNGDLDSDGQVTVYDFGILASDFGCVP